MRRIKVILGMSGGVDSSLSAYLLKEDGYEVLGMTMVLWDEKNPAFPGTPAAVHRAKAVCDFLGIEHQVWYLQDIFEKTVVDYFEKEYYAGRTPNPCVNCNRLIKWGEVIRRASALGADYVATGQYARVKKNPQTGRFEVFRSADPQKDQTYVLWGLSQQALSRALFPMGDWTKEQARSKAAGIGLPAALQEESQEICFVPNDDYKQFLLHRHPEWKNKRGEIVTTDEQVVGEHNGYWFYTIGQRRGVGVSLNVPHYVTGIDSDRNRVIIGPKEKLLARGLIARSVNFIPFEKLEAPLPVIARIRYNDNGASATVSPLDRDQVEVIFAEPRRAITPGQSVVFYQNDQLVGGGIIEQSIL